MWVHVGFTMLFNSVSLSVCIFMLRTKQNIIILCHKTNWTETADYWSLFTTLLANCKTSILELHFGHSQNTVLQAMCNMSITSLVRPIFPSDQLATLNYEPLPLANLPLSWGRGSASEYKKTNGARGPPCTTPLPVARRCLRTRGPKPHKTAS